MQRTHGRAPPGVRVVARVPHAHYVQVGTIAALSADAGVFAAHSFADGGTTAARFVAYVRDVLVPTLRPGQVVVMDNLPAHKDRRVGELLGAAGCVALRLPPYSPDYNPIEQAFAKVKAVLRSLAKRTVPDLFAGITEALKAVTTDNAKAYIGHSGYRDPAATR